MCDNRDNLGLDPADWPAFRRLAHEMLDASLDLQENIREEPAWRPVPEAVDARFREPVPRTGMGEEDVWHEVQELVFPYRTGNLHPRFWGWVGGTGSPLGTMADLLMSTLNNSAPFNDAASRVERQVVEWMKEAFGFPREASGIVTSGGSEANLVGMAVGRDARAEGDVTAAGVRGESRTPVVYTSTEAHASILKAAQVLGLGRNSVRCIEVDERYRMRVDLLEDHIQRDRRAGMHPVLLVGTAGTVNTGAVDDLEALADLAAREGLWLHVDGAFGALAALSPDHRHRVRGLDRADSLAFDFHKWLYVNYEAGCVLVRDADAHRRTFTVPATYLHVPPRGTGAWPDSRNLKGIQLSRNGKALKVWMTLKAYGLERFGRLIGRNVDQALHLASMVREHPRMELAAPTPLNVVCFRWIGEGGGEPAGSVPTVGPEAAEGAGRPPSGLDGVNLEIMMRLQERGIAVPSGTTLDGRFVLRVANVNHRSRRSDFEALVEAVDEIGRELATVEALGVSG